MTGVVGCRGGSCRGDRSRSDGGRSWRRSGGLRRHAGPRHAGPRVDGLGRAVVQADGGLGDRLLGEAEFLAAECGPDAEPGIRTIYRDAETGFNVLVHIYEKGKTGPPHDHGTSWAVYGQAGWPVDRARCIALAGENARRAEFEAHLDDPATEAALSEAAAEARGRGAFGVPTFFVGEEMFWGQDRLDFVRREVERSL